jgi:Domain of unknown function (DUF4286)
MIIYNETFIVEESIIENWFNWIKNNHIPAIMGTGYFDSYKVMTVLDSPNEGITYCFQYYTDSIERYSPFYYKEREKFHQLHNEQFENQFVLFTTLMETIDDV